MLKDLTKKSHKSIVVLGLKVFWGSTTRDATFRWRTPHFPGVLFLRDAWWLFFLKELHFGQLLKTDHCAMRFNYIFVSLTGSCQQFYVFGCSQNNCCSVCLGSIWIESERKEIKGTEEACSRKVTRSRFDSKLQVCSGNYLENRVHSGRSLGFSAARKTTKRYLLVWDQM